MINQRKELLLLAKRLKALLDLHKNPFDTSSMNEVAANAQVLFDVLIKHLKRQNNAPAPSSKALLQNVGIGEPNEASDVHLVKTLLNQRIDAKLTPDMVEVGPKTTAAIKAFEASVGLPVTGVVRVGSEIWTALSSGALPASDAIEEEASADSATNAPQARPASTGGDGIAPPAPKPEGPARAATVDTQQELLGSVGKGGDNRPEDVKRVKALFNKLRQTQLNEEDVEVGSDLMDAILALQEEVGISKLGNYSRYEGIVEPTSETWNALITNTLGFSESMYDKAPEDNTLGGAETAVEKQLAEFTMFAEGIPIDVNGEVVFVRPPYHINQATPKNDEIKKVLSAALELDRYGTDSGRSGKATPPQIQRFLQTCVDKGYVKDTSAEGMRAFLNEQGVSVDCSGLAVQAANFLLQGSDMERGAGTEPVAIMNATTMANLPKISSPSDLKAGDLMVMAGNPYGHVRILIDVDVDDDSVEFTTFESTDKDGIWDSSDGVGQRRWRFPDKDAKANLEELRNEQWTLATDDQKYIYVHFNQLKDLRTQDEQQ